MYVCIYMTDQNASKHSFKEAEGVLLLPYVYAGKQQHYLLFHSLLQTWLHIAAESNAVLRQIGWLFF